MEGATKRSTIPEISGGTATLGLTSERLGMLRRE
jgi:hypothetical protein